MNYIWYYVFIFEVCLSYPVIPRRSSATSWILLEQYLCWMVVLCDYSANSISVFIGGCFRGYVCFFLETGRRFVFVFFTWCSMCGQVVHTPSAYVHSDCRLLISYRYILQMTTQLAGRRSIEGTYKMCLRHWAEEFSAGQTMLTRKVTAGLAESNDSLLLVLWLKASCSNAG